MAHLSLSKRAQLVCQRFGLRNLDRTTLACIYRRNKVQFRKPQFYYSRKDGNRDQLQKEQFQKSMEIADLMKKGKHLIYVDETTFNQWQMPSRAWMRKDMYLKMPTSRGNSYTLIGGISDRGLIHY